MNKIAVYGSLREGEYNFEHIKESFPNQVNYIKTVNIDGFNLYNLGFYPAASKGDGKLTVDILEVEKSVENLLDRMELGAGYYIDYIYINGDKIKIYLMSDKISSMFKKINSGDWKDRNL